MRGTSPCLGKRWSKDHAAVRFRVCGGLKRLDVTNRVMVSTYKFCALVFRLMLLHESEFLQTLQELKELPKESHAPAQRHPVVLYQMLRMSTRKALPNHACGGPYFSLGHHTCCKQRQILVCVVLLVNWLRGEVQDSDLQVLSRLPASPSRPPSGWMPGGRGWPLAFATTCSALNP